MGWRPAEASPAGRGYPSKPPPSWERGLRSGNGTQLHHNELVDVANRRKSVLTIYGPRQHSQYRLKAAMGFGYQTGGAAPWRGAVFVGR